MARPARASEARARLGLGLTIVVLDHGELCAQALERGIGLDVGGVDDEAAAVEQSTLAAAGEHLGEQLLEHRAAGKAHAVGVAERRVMGQALREPIAEKAPDREVALSHPQGLAHRAKALDRRDQEQLDQDDRIDRGPALIAVEGRRRGAHRLPLQESLDPSVGVV